MSPKSRAEYFRERREKLKTFSVSVDRKKLERLEGKLAENKETKAGWLNRKIDEELGE